MHKIILNLLKRAWEQEIQSQMEIHAELKRASENKRSNAKKKFRAKLETKIPQSRSAEHWAVQSVERELTRWSDSEAKAGKRTWTRAMRKRGKARGRGVEDMAVTGESRIWRSEEGLVAFPFRFSWLGLFGIQESHLSNCYAELWSGVRATNSKLNHGLRKAYLGP